MAASSAKKSVYIVDGAADVDVGYAISASQVEAYTVDALLRHQLEPSPARLVHPLAQRHELPRCLLHDRRQLLLLLLGGVDLDVQMLEHALEPP